MNIFEMIDSKKRTADFSFMKAHPRLLFTDAKMAEVKKNIEKYPLYKRFNSDVIKYADNAVCDVVPKREGKYLGFVWRYVAYLPMMGAAYLLTGEKKYYDTIIKWLTEFLNFDMPTAHPDLDLNLSITSTALVYDWLYYELPSELKSRIKEELLRYAEAIYKMATLPEDVAWNHAVMQNHNHIAIAGLGTVALSLYEEDEALCEKYINMSVTRFSATLELTGSDGGFHEGFGYWYYGFMTPFVLFQALSDNVNVDFFSEKWFQTVGDYLLFQYFPENHFNSEYEYFNFADDVGYKRTKECMLRLVAKISKNPQLQYLAQMSYDKKLSTYHGAFLNLIWTDPDLCEESVKEADYKTSHLIDNYGYVFGRDNWSGDEACFGVHCGNPLGKVWLERIGELPFYEVGSAHCHPDAGHFILFGEGQPLFRDDEYSYYKETKHHNTLLINGNGQLGEKIQWFNISKLYIGAKHDIEYVKDTKDYIFIVADMKDAYEKTCGLKELKRYYLFIKNKNCFVVYDKIKGSKKNEYKAYFWPWDQNITRYGDGKYLITGEKANVKLCSDGFCESECVSEEIYTRYNKRRRNALTYKTCVKDGELLYAITFSKADKEPYEAKLEKNSLGFEVKLRDKKYQVNIADNSVQISNIKEEINAALPVKLFLNGICQEEFHPDKTDYILYKLPWQEPNAFFFTGTGCVTGEYKACIKDKYPVGMGNTGIKNVTASSYYYHYDALKAISENKGEAWCCDMLDEYLLIELAEESSVSKVILSFGMWERFKNKIEILISTDGREFKSCYKGTAKEEIEEFPIDYPGKAKYIKIVNHGNNYNSFLNINGIGVK